MIPMRSDRMRKDFDSGFVPRLCTHSRNCHRMSELLLKDIEEGLGFAFLKVRAIAESLEGRNDLEQLIFGVDWLKFASMIPLLPFNLHMQ